MSKFSIHAVEVKCRRLTNADYRKAIGRVLAALAELQDAAEHCLAMPPNEFNIAGMPDGWSLWDCACEDLGGLVWATSRAKPFLETVAERAEIEARRKVGHAVERMARDNAT